MTLPMYLFYSLNLHPAQALLWVANNISKQTPAKIGWILCCQSHGHGDAWTWEKNRTEAICAHCCQSAHQPQRNPHHLGGNGWRKQRKNSQDCHPAHTLLEEMYTVTVSIILYKWAGSADLEDVTNTEQDPECASRAAPTAWRNYP